MNHNDDALLSPRQLAERLGVSLRTLERMRHTGRGQLSTACQVECGAAG